MVIITLMVMLAHSLNIGKRDEGLDPGSLSWPQGFWSTAPIVLSSSHYGTVTVAFNFHPEHSVIEGYLEIICPSTVTCSSPSVGPVTHQAD